ncbi:hypothetical protein [Streptomyces sp. NPDC090298]
MYELEAHDLTDQVSTCDAFPEAIGFPGRDLLALGRRDQVDSRL